MEESPEQVLARLGRYADTLKRSSPSPIDGTPPPRRSPVFRSPVKLPEPQAVAWADPYATADDPSPTSTRDWWHSIDRERLLRRSALHATIFGQVLAAIACVASVLAFVRFDRAIAYLIVGVMIAVGSIAVVRRVPLALWWTFGALLGFAIGLWS